MRDGTNWSERVKGSEFRVVWWLSRGKKEGRERRKSFFFFYSVERTGGRGGSVRK